MHGFILSVHAQQIYETSNLCLRILNVRLCHLWRCKSSRVHCVGVLEPEPLGKFIRAQGHKDRDAQREEGINVWHKGNSEDNRQDSDLQERELVYGLEGHLTALQISQGDLTPPQS